MANGTLLVVDDDDGIRQLLAEFFREHSGIQIDTARDGAEALHQLSSKPYSVIVLDLVMPHMSGIDFLDSLAALTTDPSVKGLESPPAVFVVTSVPPDDIPSCDIESRCRPFVRGVLRKPLDVRALARSVEALL